MCAPSRQYILLVFSLSLSLSLPLSISWWPSLLSSHYAHVRTQHDLNQFISIYYLPTCIYLNTYRHSNFTSQAKKKNRLIYSTDTELHQWSSASLNKGHCIEYKTEKNIRRFTHKIITINAYMYACVHKKDHIQVLSFSHQLDACRPIIFFLCRHAIILSLSLINEQINICVCVLFVSLHSESESAVLCCIFDSYLFDSEEKEKEKKKNSYIMTVNICNSHNNNSTF